MKLINTVNGEVLADITTNHSMSVDDILTLMQYTVTEDGEIMDGDETLNAAYEDLDIIAD